MWIYCDLGLVAKLLHPASSPARAAEDIGEYFATRLWAFSRADHERHLDVIERDWVGWDSSIPGWDATGWPNLATDSDLMAEGGALLQTAADELSVAAEEKVDPPFDRLALIDYASFAQRGVVRVGTATVDVRVHESGWTAVRTVDGRPLFGGHWAGWDPALAGQNGEGTVTAYANPTLGWTFACWYPFTGG
jgi:hypothetical protein